MIYNTYFTVLGLQDSLGVLPNLGLLPTLGRLDDLGEYAFSPKSLFSNGEQGAWYDPSDLTTLFQDAAGTTAVTAVEQPVSLMLDKRLGGLNALGADVVTNGTFTTDTDWTKGTGWVISGGKATFTSSGTPTGMTQVCLTVGRWYQVRVTVSDYAGTGGFNIYSGTDATIPVLALRDITANGTYTGYIYAYATTLYVRGSGSGGTTASFDNVSVREVPGNHAYTPSSASTSRPVLSARVNQLTATEDFSNAAWIKTNATVTGGFQDPKGGSNAFRVVTSATGDSGIQQLYSGATASLTLTTGFWVKSNTGVNQQVRIKNTHAAVLDNFLTVTATPDWQWFPFTVTNGASAGSGQYAGVRSTATTTIDVLVYGADLRVTNDGVGLPVYQRVTTSTDYDTTGFPLYLRADGSDDYMLTSSIDFATVTSDGLARRNLLTVPTQFDDAAWVVNATTIVANTSATLAPDGTQTAEILRDTATTNAHRVEQASITPASGVQYTLTAYVKKNTRRYVGLGWTRTATAQAGAGFDLDTGTVTGTGALGAGYAASNAFITNVGNGWYRIGVTVTGSVAQQYPCIANQDTAYAGGAVRFDESYAGNTSNETYIWGAQLELGTTATAFQNIGTDKMTVVAGVRKLSDAALGMLTELSTTLASNNGTFNVQAPSIASGSDFQFSSKGTIEAALNGDNYPTPLTTVLTGRSQISTAFDELRLGGLQVDADSGTQGTGNFGNYPLYLFRRGGTTLPFNGRLFGLVVRGAATDDSTIASVESWMANKTGVALDTTPDYTFIIDDVGDFVVDDYNNNVFLEVS